MTYKTLLNEEDILKDVSSNSSLKLDLKLDWLNRRIYLAYFLNKLEIIGLFILSTFTSMSNYGKQKLFFNSNPLKITLISNFK